MERSVLCLLTVALALVILHSAECRLPPPRPPYVDFCRFLTRKCDECSRMCRCPPHLTCCYDGCRRTCMKECPDAMLLLHPPCKDECISDDKCGPCRKCECTGCCSKCVPVPLPPRHECDKCSIDCECKPGMRCCPDGCWKKCMKTRPDGECPPFPVGGSCFKCKTDRDCPRCHECKVSPCESRCVPEISIRPGPCDECGMHCHCKPGMRCCPDGCKKKCMKTRPDGDCPPIPVERPCCDTDKDCKRCHICKKVSPCESRCVPEISIRPGPCDECGMHCDCKPGMRCCPDGCKKKCMKTRPDGECPPFAVGRPCIECDTHRDCKKCQICKKVSPCERRCVPDVSIVKEGDCPKIFPFIHCKECTSEYDCPRSLKCCHGRCSQVPCCDSDCDCYGILKCCDNKCGKHCMAPVSSPVKQCPRISLRFCYEDCKSHIECRRPQICCYDGCGMKCLHPGGCKRWFPPPMSCKVRECRIDRDCKRGEKCCKTNCGFQCLKAV